MAERAKRASLGKAVQAKITEPKDSNEFKQWVQAKLAIATYKKERDERMEQGMFKVNKFFQILPSSFFEPAVSTLATTTTRDARKHYSPKTHSKSKHASVRDLYKAPKASTLHDQSKPLSLLPKDAFKSKNPTPGTSSESQPLKPKKSTKVDIKVSKDLCKIPKAFSSKPKNLESFPAKKPTKANPKVSKNLCKTPKAFFSKFETLEPFPLKKPTKIDPKLPCSIDLHRISKIPPSKTFFQHKELEAEPFGSKDPSLLVLLDELVNLADSSTITNGTGLKGKEGSAALYLQEFRPNTVSRIFKRRNRLR